MNSKLTYPLQCQIAEALEINLIKAIDKIVELDIKGRKTCVWCDHFDVEKEVCKKYNQRPPANIIAFGCEEFDNNDDIPF